MTNQTKYHVTSIRNGGVYGHECQYCDEGGCSGNELYLGTEEELESEIEDEILTIVEAA